MKVFKTLDYATLAGEMINMESGQFWFEGGKLVGDGTQPYPIAPSGKVHIRRFDTKFTIYTVQTIQAKMLSKHLLELIKLTSFDQFKPHPILIENETTVWQEPPKLCKGLVASKLQIRNTHAGTRFQWSFDTPQFGHIFDTYGSILLDTEDLFDFADGEIVTGKPSVIDSFRYVNNLVRDNHYVMQFGIKKNAQFRHEWFLSDIYRILSNYIIPDLRWHKYSEDMATHCYRCNRPIYDLGYMAKTINNIDPKTIKRADDQTDKHPKTNKIHTPMMHCGGCVRSSYYMESYVHPKGKYESFCVPYPTTSYDWYVDSNLDVKAGVVKALLTEEIRHLADQLYLIGDKYLGVEALNNEVLACLTPYYNDYKDRKVIRITLHD